MVRKWRAVNSDEIEEKGSGSGAAMSGRWGGQGGRSASWVVDGEGETGVDSDDAA